MQHFWHIIANPAAGNGKVSKQWPAIEQILQKLGFSYAIHFTTHRGHAIRLVDDIVLRGGRYILGLGGDGTNHEIVNGIMEQTHVPSTEILYALLPIGTGNDWARHYGIATHAEKRLSGLLEPQTAIQDIGRVDYTDQSGQLTHRYFVNVAGMAYDGYVARRMEEDGKSNNRLQYLLAVSRYLFEYDLSPARLLWDEHSVEDHFYTVNVGICKYSGGGMQLVPHAVADDGLFALTYAERLPRWEVLLQTPRFYNGTLLDHRKLHGEQVQSLRVQPTSAIPFLLEADGEYLGHCPAEFTMFEKALKLAR